MKADTVESNRAIEGQQMTQYPKGTVADLTVRYPSQAEILRPRAILVENLDGIQHWHCDDCRILYVDDESIAVVNVLGVFKVDDMVLSAIAGAEAREPERIRQGHLTGLLGEAQRVHGLNAVAIPPEPSHRARVFDAANREWVLTYDEEQWSCLNDKAVTSWKELVTRCGPLRVKYGSVG